MLFAGTGLVFTLSEPEENKMELLPLAMFVFPEFTNRLFDAATETHTISDVVTPPLSSIALAVMA